MARQPWFELSDEQILKLRIRDLHLKIEETELHPFVEKIFEELEAKGLNFRPRVYFGDEWFSPEGICAVAVPFFLAHARLRVIEKKHLLEIEGETAEEFARYFRHELGHAFDHLFKVSSRPGWRRVFGSPDKAYNPETYRPRPYSKNYVQNINRWYAQAHPDEDFAETFAVWLDPHSNWRKEYKDWAGALRKLEYLDRIIKRFRGRKNKVPTGRMLSDARHLSIRLDHYYDKKRKQFAEDYPDFYDPDLLRIFGQKGDATDKTAISAKAFMRANRKDLILSVGHWTRERKVTIEDLLSDLSRRCGELNLVLKNSETKTMGEISAFLAALVSNYLFTGHFKRRV